MSFFIKTSSPLISDEELVRRASLGLSPDLAEAAPYLPKWVAIWSGGVSGSVLADIERFEQHLVKLGYPHWDETDNPACRRFLGVGAGAGGVA